MEERGEEGAVSPVFPKPWLDCAGIKFHNKNKQQGTPSPLHFLCSFHLSHPLLPPSLPLQLLYFWPFPPIFWCSHHNKGTSCNQPITPQMVMSLESGWINPVSVMSEVSRQKCFTPHAACYLNWLIYQTSTSLWVQWEKGCQRTDLPYDPMQLEQPSMTMAAVAEGVKWSSSNQKVVWMCLCVNGWLAINCTV